MWHDRPILQLILVIIAIPSATSVLRDYLTPRVTFSVRISPRNFANIAILRLGSVLLKLEGVELQLEDESNSLTCLMGDNFNREH